eukprot:gene27005-33661_t
MNSIAHSHPKQKSPLHATFKVGARTVTLNRIASAAINWPNGPVVLHGPTANDNVVMVTDRLILNHHLRMIPYAMKDILSCSGLKEGAEYLWWRSISIAYLVRPNKHLLAMIETHRDKTVQKTQ